MEDKFKLLECDDDVVSFTAAATFKIGQLKERWRQELNRKVELYGIKSSDVVGILSEVPTPLCKINWKSDNNGINCEFLRLGSKSWQTGKLRVQLNLEISRNSSKNKFIVDLEFCPDEPEISQPESPLDDMRKMINEDK